MFENNIIGLFPTPVYKNNFMNDISYLKNDILKIVQEDSKLSENQGNTTFFHNNVNSYLDLDLFSPLKKIIQQEINSFKENVLCWPKDINIELSSSWLNYSNKKENYHHDHYHPNSYLSGVFYFKTIEPEDKIFFKNPLINNNNLYYNIDFDMDIGNYNYFNSLTWWINVSSYDLIMFPSGLRHFVEPNNDCNEKNDRLSLSFNTKLVGEYPASNRNDSVYWEAK